MSRSIIITSTPEGKIPIQVREQWVGLEIPDVGFGIIFLHNYHTGVIDITKRIAYVRKEIAIEVLSQKSPEAADWFRRDTIYSQAEYIGFDQDCFNIIVRTEIVKCPNCNRESTDYSCRICCGTGWIAVESGKIQPFNKLCAFCGGTRIFGTDNQMKAKKCSSCDGTGFNN